MGEKTARAIVRFKHRPATSEWKQGMGPASQWQGAGPTGTRPSVGREGMEGVVFVEEVGVRFVFLPMV
jgi:hypothetical protein